MPNGSFFLQPFSAVAHNTSCLLHHFYFVPNCLYLFLPIFCLWTTIFLAAPTCEWLESRSWNNWRRKTTPETTPYSSLPRTQSKPHCCIKMRKAFYRSQFSHITLMPRARAYSRGIRVHNTALRYVSCSGFPSLSSPCLRSCSLGI